MRSIYSFIYSFFIYNMAQILKYSSGGTSPKPIKIGSKYYTKEQLKSDLYGDKLDEYIKFREFNSKEAANFRKNLNNQVDALINGRLTLEGNTLIDSKGEWSNNGEYAKPKLFGKLNEEQKANNDSLDVANYLVRALNSNKLSTYTAPSEYNLFESDTFKTYDNIQDDEQWLKESVDSRRNRIANSLEAEANKLQNDLNYQDKYSYEGWQDAKWDQRANATIQKLKNAANILKNPAVKGIDLKLQLNSLGYGDLMDLLAEQEVANTTGGNSASSGTGNSQNKPESKLFSITPQGLFNFTAPKITYKGKEYTYGTPEFNSIQDQVIKDEKGEDITIGAYLKRKAGKQSKVDRSHPDFATAPSGYNYFINVTQNFKRGNNKSNIRAAYLLRRDPLDASNSILRVVYGDKRAGSYYLYDGRTKTAYAAGFDSNGNPYRIEGASPIRLDSLDTVIPTSVAESPDNFSTDLIFGQYGNFDVEKLDKFIKNNVNLINSNKLIINNYIGGLRKLLKATQGTAKRKAGELKQKNKTYYYIDFYGTNKERPLRIYFKNKAFRDRANIENDLDAQWIQGVKLPEWKQVSAPGEQGHSYDSIDTYDIPVPENKEGGVLKAQLGVKVSDEVPEPVNTQPKPKKKGPLNGRDMTLSSVNNYNKELEAGQDFDAGEARRLAYSLIDLGSAVGSLIPGANLASTAVGVAMTTANAAEDFSDAIEGKMSYWDATKNAGVNLGLDAISLLPALKAVKIGKIAKTVLKTIPRLFGYAQAVNLITSEDAKALGKTFAKIGSGNLDQLNTQDFTNITQAIRIATMIGRDTKGTYRKAKSKIGSKTGEVEIKGTVGDQEVVTRVKREDVTSKKLGYKYIDDTKVKQKLVAEANSNSKYTKPQVQETDADGKKLTNEDGTPKMKTSDFEVKDVKNIDRTVLRDHTFDQQVGHPKALFEGWFGYKGLNAPMSDAYIAKNWDPIRAVNGQITKASKKAASETKLPGASELKSKVEQMRKDKLISEEQANKILESGITRKAFVEKMASKEKMTPEEYIKYITDNGSYKKTVDSYINSQVENLNQRESSIRQSIENSQQKGAAASAKQKAQQEAAKAKKQIEHQKVVEQKKQLKEERKQKRQDYKDLKKYAESILSKQEDKTLKDALGKLSSQKRKKVLQKAQQMSKSATSKDVRDNNFLSSLKWQYLNNEFKQGGSIERGLSLINAYKSGGLVIPKFKDSGAINPYLYKDNNPFLGKIPNRNTSTISNDMLDDVFILKDTNSQSGEDEGLRGAAITPNNVTYRHGVNIFNNYISSGNFVGDVSKYIRDHTYQEYNSKLSELRRLRSLFEQKGYKYTSDNVRNFNKLFIELFPNYNKYSENLNNIYGTSTLERLIVAFNDLKDQEDYRKDYIDKDDKKVWLDNAGYAWEGEYGKGPVLNQGTPGGAPGNAPGTGVTTGIKPETGAKPGDETARTGSQQYTSDLFKYKTKLNPIQWLRMAELAGALGTNAKATDELLKYRSYNQDAPYRLAYLYDKYPLIAATQNQVGSLNTQLSTPTTADLGSYLASRQTGFSKGLTAMQNAYNENYNTFLTSKAGVQEAANYNNAAEVEAANNNVARAVTAENMKHKAKADLYSANFAQGIKPFLSETRQYMQDAAKLRQKANYDVQSAVAKQQFDNEVAAINENYVKNIKDAEFLKANEGKSDYAIIQAWLTKHPNETNGYKALLETPTMKYYKTQAKLSETLAPEIGFFNTEMLAYDFKKSGGQLTAKDRMKIQKVKDYNAARRQDSKESLKSITKDKEEFGKNYRAMSAGTLKMLERTLK